MRESIRSGWVNVRIVKDWSLRIKFLFWQNRNADSFSYRKEFFSECTSMTRYKVIYSCFVIALASILTTLVLVAPTYAGGDFTLHTLAGTSWQKWSSGLDKNPVKVETESLSALRLEERLSWRGRTLLSLAHNRSLNGSVAQEQMLELSGEQKSSLQETLGVLDLLAFVAGGEKASNGEMSFLHRMLGLRISYTHNLHHGRTSSVDNFAYLDFSGWDNIVLFADGAQLPFRTLFRDLRILTPVWYDPIYPGAVVRIGYFRSRWEKIAPAWNITLDGTPVIQDTRRDTGGLTLSYDNSLDWPGVGWGVSLDAGLLGTGMSTPESNVPAEDSNPTYSAVRAEIRWNFGSDDGRNGLAASLGAVFEWRSWQNNGNPIDRDLLTRIFGRVGFDLVL